MRKFLVLIPLLLSCSTATANPEGGGWEYPTVLYVYVRNPSQMYEYDTKSTIGLNNLRYLVVDGGSSLDVRYMIKEVEHRETFGNAQWVAYF